MSSSTVLKNAVHHGGKVCLQGWSGPCMDQETETDKGRPVLGLDSPLCLFLVPKTPAHGMMLPTF